MISPFDFAEKALNANPKYMNSPMGQQLMSCLKSGNASVGEQLANNILQTYGLNKEDAIKQASEGLTQMFHLQ